MVLRHMSDIPNKNQIVTAREICLLYHIPFDTTAKVMQTMSSHGILESIKGQKGGHRLTSNLNEISYMQLTEIIEGKKLRRCHELGCDLVKSCNITGPVEKLNDQLYHFFSELPLSDLLASSSNSNL